MFNHNSIVFPRIVKPGGVLEIFASFVAKVVDYYRILDKNEHMWYNEIKKVGAHLKSSPHHGTRERKIVMAKEWLAGCYLVFMSVYVLLLLILGERGEEIYRDTRLVVFLAGFVVGVVYIVLDLLERRGKAK